MDWTVSLWNKNKWLFFLFIPVVLIILFKDVILAVLQGQIHALVETAKKKDAELKAEANKMNNEANKLKADAGRDGKEIDNLNNSDIPNDWHKRR